MRNQFPYRKLLAATSIVALAAPALAGTTTGVNGNPDTISISGSTALKNFVTGPGMTQLEPGTSITLGSGTYSPNWITYDSNGNQTGGTVSQFQLAPSVYQAPVTTGANQTANALRVEYHESGSVEGILELANDQIGPVTYVENNIDRNPNNGNAVWVNGNQIGGVSPPGGQQLGSAPGGYYLGPMYGANGSTVITYGPGVEPTFNLAGQNVSPITGATYSQAGQNAVQLAISDVVPVQAFQNTSAASNSHLSQPWLQTPSDLGYGSGNTLLTNGGLGFAGGNNPLQTSTALNMPATAINPRTGTAFGSGPWNSAGLGNLDSRQAAVSATLFVANPGTGLDRLDRTDAQWLQTTGRLANGAAFDMTTRDVNSGTRNVAALNTGLDPSYAVGVNDAGNGNSSTGATTQINIGAGLKFSNKTAGGAQLRPTVQNTRMGVGTLSVGDANGVFATGNAYGLRALQYSDSATGSSPYVPVTTQNILNGNYVIYQNEQFVTLKAPTAADSGETTAQWAAKQSGTAPGNVAVQGDNATNDVAQVRDNVLNTVSALTTANSSNPTYQQVLQNLGNSSYAFITKGFILPQFMSVEKNQDGINQSMANNTTNFPGTTTPYDPGLSSAFVSSYSNFTTASNPDTVFGGSTDVYGGKGTNTAAFNSKINITNSNGGNGGNYLFGNFNQNGIRDFDSTVVTGLAALTALESNPAYGTSSFSGDSNSTVIPGLPTALASMTNQQGGIGATKGDLIVMGDFDGRGVFDGKSLYEMAVGASIADGTAAPDPTQLNAGGNDHLTLQSQSVTLENANGTGTTSVTTETFGDAVRRGSLYKNDALAYLNNFATGQMKTEARATLSLPGTASVVPSGATDLGADPANPGNELFTYDPTGAKAFNNHDVNRDGVVDMNDAVQVDDANGKDYTSMSDALTTTVQAPVTGQTQLANLVLLKQSDSSTVIGVSDVTAINSGLAVAGNSNWYAYSGAPLVKTGPNPITWARPALGSTNTVYTGAAFNINGGTVQVASGSLDPFSDNTGSVATGTNHVAVTVNTGGTLAFQGSGNTSTVGGLTITGGTVDVAGNTLIIQNTNLATVQGYIRTGYNSGAWGGHGLTTSLATPTTGLGYLDEGGGIVKVQYAALGDTNLDGTVNFSDLLTLAIDYNMTGADWAQGDFNYDNSVNFSDLLTLAINYGDSLTPGQAVSNGISPSFAADWNLAVSEVNASVPEPTSFSLLAIGATTLLARRRRRAAN